MNDQELIERRREGRAEYYVQTFAADRIEKLTAKVKLLEKVEMYLKTSYPDKTGSYFICGEGGVKDNNGLPERLHVCPAYGVDWMMTYTRTDKTTGPEY